MKAHSLVVTLVLAASSLTVACGASTPTPADSTTATASTLPAAKADVLATAESAGSFKTLLAAIKAAGLEDTLKGAGPFTVFAPTDEAFAKLPAGAVEGLLKPENKDKLKAVLTYHVVAGKVASTEVVKMSSAKTVQGKDVAIKMSGGDVMINNAKVVKADVAASNGVIHVIDSVLMPQ